ncbi:MAG: lamin tail domain-containing protein [bacterium]
MKEVSATIRTFDLFVSRVVKPVYLPQAKGNAMKNVTRFMLGVVMLVQGLAFSPITHAQIVKKAIIKRDSISKATPPEASKAGKFYLPTKWPIQAFAPVDVRKVAEQEALDPSIANVRAEIRAIQAPRGDRPTHRTVPIMLPGKASSKGIRVGIEDAPLPSPTGPSPGPTKTFKGEFLSGGTIPPDTMGAVGITHVVTATNDRLRIQTRDGVELSRVTINSFWAGATVKGVAVASAFDTKVYYDRFNDRFILISSLNGPSINSGAGIAVTQTSDPTGLWNRYTVASDPASTVSAGHAIDYPSVGFNKNWIVVNENVFNYSGSAFTSYFGQQIFVLDKAAAYANTLSSVSLFEGPVTACDGTEDAKQLGCGFTMAPALVEDNTTDVDYLLEDWDNTAGQLRLSKITGTPSAPVLTVGTQFPQSTLSWRFNASRIGTTGGYAPQKQQSAFLTSGTRIMANDSRIQNTVFRAGSLWTTHTVLLAQTPTPAGTAVGGTTNPDTHSAVQWWQIDPTIETGLAVPPVQRARIEDPTADNCHDGAAGTRTTGTCISTATQVGQFYAYPNISVNQNNDVLLGFTQFSNLTYPSSGYALRLVADPVNTTRDPVVFRPGQANYNIGAGSGTGRQNRWGDYSGSQTDPLDDTTFWTVQEYAGAQRDFGIGIAGPWETWWAQVKPSTAPPTTSGNLIISEFRLRGPQGANDEFVELYNPGAASLIVNTTDNSDGWALAYSNTAGTVTGVSVIPNGTVIPSGGHFLVARNQDPANGPALVYSLNGYAAATNPASVVRGADSDVGYAIDNADNGGFAIFKTSTVANFSALNRMDSAGFAGVPVGLFKEGTGIPAITASTPTGQLTFYRDLTSGVPKDTGANENDFIFADPAIETLTVEPKLGAAGPENLDGPLQRNATVKAGIIDPGCSGSGAPTTACARARDNTPVTNGTLGTLSVRRKFTNATGAPVTRLRFRMVDLTSCTIQPCTPGSSAPPGIADLRALTSVDIPAATLSGGGTVTIRGLTLEEPPTQANGGGLNASVTAGTITLSAPLAVGASINVHFLLGVQQSGAYRVFVNVEALP